MGNPLYDRFGNNHTNMPNWYVDTQNMLKQFQKFRQNFQGDPRALVQELLNSGQMTQEQFNQLSNMASQFQNIFK